MSLENNRFDLLGAPLRIGAVRLNVRDLDTVAAFYQRVIGLTAIESGAQDISLGVSGNALLHLHGDPALKPNDPRQAGLFHTAFLLPSRADLARWLMHAGEAGIRLQGASDHIVSEAIYLADPEGNGIEVYADRTTDHWRDSAGEMRISTEPLDRPGLLAEAAGSSWTGFPEGGMVGHVHLQVGNTTHAERFYSGILGFDITARYPGASFFGSGGYHHQLGGNVWNSRGAGPRPNGMAGLDLVEIILRDSSQGEDISARAGNAGIAVERRNGAIALRDPWGTRLVLACL